MFCNCDDPYESNFFQYFVLNFGRLKLKKLIATCYAGSPIAGQQLMLFEGPETERTPYKAVVTKVYDKTGDDAVDMRDVRALIESGEIPIERLQGDGDFRSAECIELLKEADIVVTNPPFSLFREYVAQLVEYGKKFLIIGAFKRAVEVDDYLLKNPFSGVNMGAEAREVIPERGQDVQRRLPFTLEEIRFMIRSFPEPWNDMVAVSFFLGGLRLSDVCMLRWDAINWRDRVVSYTEVKTGKKRLQPFGAKLEGVFERRRKQFDGYEEYVFPDMAHAYVGSSRTSISTQFTTLLRAFGMVAGTVDAGKRKGTKRHAVSAKSFHSIRHAAVTYFYGGFADGHSNYSQEMIMNFIGHTSPEVERGYITASIDAKRPMAQSLEDAVFSEAGETGKDRCTI